MQEARCWCERSADGDGMSLIPSGDWYELLTNDCRAIVTETVYSARQTMLEGMHQLGERIVTDENFQKFAKGKTTSLSALSNIAGVGERTLRRAMQFYEKYPTMQKVQELPEGKNLSWNKIITNYLPKDTTDRDPLPRLIRDLVRTATELLSHKLTGDQQAAAERVLEVF